MVRFLSLLLAALARLPNLGLHPFLFAFAPPLDFLPSFACHLTSLSISLVEWDRSFHLCAGLEMDSGRSRERFALARAVFHVGVVVAGIKFEAMLTAGLALRDPCLGTAAQNHNPRRIVYRNLRQDWLHDEFGFLDLVESQQRAMPGCERHCMPVVALRGRIDVNVDLA